MNKRVLIIVTVIIALIGAGMLYLALQSDTPTKNAVPETASKATQENKTQPVVSMGVYTDYHEGIIAETKGTKLLFFHAPWCPQCRALEADIKEKGVPDNTTIIKVDYDSNQKLRQLYGVTLQTTVVKVDDQGRLIKKFTAYNDPSLSAVVRELL